MRRHAAALLISIAAAACRRPLAPQPAPTGVAADVAHLASAALEGRAAGTAGNDSAAAYIARRYQALGFRGAFKVPCGAAADCAAAYFQFFTGDDSRGHNVAAVVPGADPALRDQYIVVGAHYDHLGRSPRDARDPEVGSAVRPGADDNASGAAAVLELGRRLAERPPPRSVVLAHFDAEELGLVGSGVFVDHLPVARRGVLLMLNLDMVGRLRTGGLTVDVSVAGAARRALRPLLDSAAAAARVRLRYSSVIAGRSDHASFGRAGIPAVALFTGFHADYHRASDVASRVDTRGIERVVDVVEAVVREPGGALASVSPWR